MTDVPKKRSFKVILDREACIGAASCVAIAPKHWKMQDDGKVDLLHAKRSKDNKYHEKLITEDELEEMKFAAESCPVNAIHIEDDETGEKVV